MHGRLLEKRPERCPCCNYVDTLSKGTAPPEVEASGIRCVQNRCGCAVHQMGVPYMQFSSLGTFTVDSFSKSCIMVMQCTANSAGECHLDVVEVEGSNPPPCINRNSPFRYPEGAFSFLYTFLHLLHMYHVHVPSIHLQG